MRIPTATYRLQFNGHFGFKDAQRLVPYLHSLGITDIYASPILQSRRGSGHGYDVTDPTRLDPEIGTDEMFESLVNELRQHGMGLLLDIVPNHMAASSENPWWMDVLENGPSSTYANFFDIDWRPPDRLLENKVLLPLLAGPYARTLEDQKLTLVYEENGFFVRYMDMRLPLAPKSYVRILTYGLDDLKRSLAADAAVLRELTGVLSAVMDLPDRSAPTSEGIGERLQQRESIRERLGRLYRDSSEIRGFINGNLQAFNGKKRRPGSFLPLDELLRDQAYVLSFWRVANEEINYRRFFSITDLVGVRVEDPVVFDATHAAVFRLIGKNAVTGLRIDHIDGLADPLGYLRKLQERLTPDMPRAARPGFYVIVEKILAKDEPLPRSWPVCGTSGYDFLNVLNGFFVDSAGHKTLTNTYAQFLGKKPDYDLLVYNKKKQIMETILAAEMRSLGHHLRLLAEEDRYARDFPLSDLTQTLVETTACLPVYRTYLRNFDVVPSEHRYIKGAVNAARRRNPSLNPDCYNFLESVLSLQEKPHLSSGQREGRLNFVMRWQQFSVPIMAKGFEDTVLYVYNPLVSANEVGGRPHSPAVPAAEFHAYCLDRTKHWPHAMNATSTHDTKRSEDVRARINVLSELPMEWNRRLNQWSRWNKKTRVNGRPVPDPNEEILLYQTMLGAWPLEESEIPAFRKRLQDYMTKAVREAMVHTRWSRPNLEHEKTLAHFIRRIVNGPKTSRFLKDFLEFQQKVSYYGALNSLAQLTMKATAPGMPDFYQGSELWDLRLVDPDNRGPVDFERRTRLLEELESETSADDPAFIENLLAHWKDGRIKLFLTSRLLNYRKTHPQLFGEGDYLPVHVSGKKNENVCAFIRHKGNAWVLVVVPRFMAAITSLTGGSDAPLGEKVWGGSYLVLTGETPATWKNILTQETITAAIVKGRKMLPLANVLCRFPVGLFETG
ncbi:MAG: malto-oligosyltrehalose synthase [Terriglobia bacterium]